MTCLVLSRNEGDAVRLGDDVYVTVKEVRRAEVLLRCTRVGDPLGTLVRIPHCQAREVVPGVHITLRSVCGRQVKLAFDAPQDVVILRTELLKRELVK